MRHTTVGCAAVLLAAPHAFALNGNEIVLRSTGAASGSDWTLSSNGYVGTYVTLAQPGAVTFTINASGVADGGAPNMNLVIGDSRSSFAVGSGFNTYTSTLDLSAGTHFVRTEFNNDLPTAANRALTVRSLNVSGGGATFSNVSNNANALAAADTYIQTGRKGEAKVSLHGVAAGTQVGVKLVNHAFQFGTAVPGTSTATVNNYLGSTGTTQQQSYQARLLENFNTIVPENVGKWSSNASTSTAVSMGGVDSVLNFAQNHDLKARMHNLIWGAQQPGWVNTLLTNAVDDLGTSDDAAAAAAKATLRTEISERIDYYVGAGSAGDRAHNYIELDVYNESYHTGSAASGDNNYWDIYGAQGVADIYREARDAAAASGADVKMFVNEYGVLDNTSYANFYARNIEAIRSAGIAAGYGDTVGGIGVQHYPAGGSHVASRVTGVLQNLSVQGLPIVLSEFGVDNSIGKDAAAQVLAESLRLVFGHADATGFLMWGFQNEGNGNLFRPAAALYDVANSGSGPDWNNWTLTAAGQAWQDLLGIHDWDGNAANGWTTDLNLIVGADGTIDFTGFYGDYAITIGGQTYDLSLVKGTEFYTLAVPEPTAMVLLAALPLVGRRRRRSSND